MTADLSIIHVLAHASPVVQIVMALLLIVSLISWTRIFQRSWILKKARRAADAFEDRFWSGGDLSVLYNKITARQGSRTGMEVIFEGICSVAATKC